MITELNDIGNHYGTLCIKVENSKYYMRVTCELKEKKWKEISKILYDELLNLNKL